MNNLNENQNKFWRSEEFPYFTEIPVLGVEPFMILSDLDAQTLTQKAELVSDILEASCLQARDLMIGFIYLAFKNQELKK